MKSILFDLDETLVDRSETMRRFLLEQYRRFGHLLNVPKDAFVESVISHQKNGYENKRKAYELACAELSVAPHFGETLFVDFKGSYGFDAALFEGVEEVLTDLSRTYSLAIVTNGRARCQNAKIDCLNIRRYFEVIKISEEFGAKKPDPRIFESCLEDLGSKASECVCIGDNPDNDLRPAQELGMKTIWVRNPNFTIAQRVDGIVDTVANVSEVIAKLNAEQDVPPKSDRAGG